MTPDAPRDETEIDLALLERYWFGGASGVEMATVDAWFAQHPRQHIWYEQLRRGLLAESDARAVTLADVHRLIGTVLESATQAPGSTAATARRTQRAPVDAALLRKGSTAPTARFATPARRWVAWSILTGVAAMLVALFGGRAIVRHFAAEPGMAATITYATSRAERARITLPDGSRVTLDVASRLDVPTDFVHGNRTLHLTGEALFSVVHRGAQPFTVVAGETKAQVLGTTFMVRKYPEDSTVTIAVQEGRVGVRSAVVAANQYLEVPVAGPLRMGAADSAQFAFATGLLTFNWVPLKDAIPDLDRWYDTDIRVTTPMLEQVRIKASFAAGSRADLAAMLALALHAQVVQDGHVLTFSPK